MKGGKTAPAPDTINPYLAARREWNERYGDYIAQARAWRVLAFLSAIAAVVAIGGIVWIAGQSRIVPFVVEVDKLGDAVAARRADVAAPADPRIIRSQIARWISDIRGVYLDAAAERAQVVEGYAMVNRRAAAYIALNEHMRGNDPFERAKKESVAVHVRSVLPLSDRTWRVEWQEDVRARDGSLVQSQQWQASVTVSIAPPKDDATLIANPAGVYVDAFSWSPRL